MKILQLLVLLAIAVVVILKFKLLIFGVVLGALGAIVYFSLTNSVLNWKKPKK